MTPPAKRVTSSPVEQLDRALDERQIAGHSLRWYISGWRLGLIALVIASLFPLFTDATLQVTAIAIGIYVLLALGLNIVVGYAGLLDLGYVAFFVIGSYTVAIGTSGFIQSAQKQTVPLPILSFWVLLPIAAVLAGLFGVLLGAPTLRLRGDYLAIVTLGFGEIVPIIFRNIPFFFGELGMGASPPADFGPITFSDPLNRSAFYYLTLILVVIVVIAVAALRDSSLGRAWIAIREDETAASAAGVSLVRTKLLAFGLGAVTGGIGGALNAAYLTAVAPSDFNFAVSITILVMIVLGGIGSIPGVILGAAILRYFDVYLIGQISQFFQTTPTITDPASPIHFLAVIDVNTAKSLFYGLLLVGMILLRPQGLIPDRRRQRELRGIGASAEGASAVGLLEREEADLDVPGEEIAGSETTFAGAGSDAQGREG